MTPQQALGILDEALQPQAIGRFTRQGYVQIQQALDALGTYVQLTQHAAASPGTNGVGGEVLRVARPEGGAVEPAAAAKGDNSAR